MPLFNNAAIAALLKATDNSNSASNKNSITRKECQTRICETGSADGRDCATTRIPTLQEIVGIIKVQEESLELVGQQEWMEATLKLPFGTTLTQSLQKLGAN
jgi:hypothetical protein